MRNRQRSERASRPLDGTLPVVPTPAPLTEADKVDIATHAKTMEHRLKVARALSAAELIEDALPPLFEALYHACCILAVTQHLSKPQAEDDIVRAPWIRLWEKPARNALESPTAAAPEVLRVLMAEADRVLNLARSV